MRQLGIIGASGHGRVVADIAVRRGYDDIVFFDDNEREKICSGYSVVGKCEDILNYLGKSEVFVAIGNASVRKKMLEDLIDRGAKIATLIHPDAVVGSRVKIGIGTAVMAGAVLNPECKIGRGCIVNTSASVDHDCCLGNYVHVSVGAHVAGTVTIGNDTWIGAGAIINNNIHITDSCMIGAGAVVIDDILEEGTYIGVPARKLKVRKEEKKEHFSVDWGGVILWNRQFNTKRTVVLLLLQLTILQLCRGRQQ